MRVHIGSDHAGFELKTFLIDKLGAAGHEVVDHGPTSYEPEDDYPDYCIPVGEGVVADPGSLGIVIGGSGNGEQIAANKARGCRAVLAYSAEIAQLGRLHNDANVLAIGARFTAPDEALELATTFLGTEFSGAERHARRIGILARYEADGHL